MLVPAGFNIDPEPNGDILMYPEGDKCPPSGRMPKEDGILTIVRQPPLDDANLNVETTLKSLGLTAGRFGTLCRTD